MTRWRCLDRDRGTAVAQGAMRSLEKARSLDELVAQHLARSRMEAIRLQAFNFMLGEGRIALLFDGFDELALRVSYDRAAEARTGEALEIDVRGRHHPDLDGARRSLHRRARAPAGWMGRLLP
ncbi:hypothetical protein WME99_29970 [Sorangium sp. So ce136]|uniref:hypothetical protein n=1 Tax=Sorangium sp. So ce136 TaxID=3133284 RepID=UPI003F09DAE1